MAFVVVCCVSMIFVKCTKIKCGIFTFQNHTEQTITLKTYNLHYAPYPNESFEGLKPGGSFRLEAEYCSHKGYHEGPFTHVDSMFLIFNDTLRVVIFNDTVGFGQSIFGDSIFYPFQLVIDNWNLLFTADSERRYYYEYVFTDWHYQRALEAYGLK